MQNKLKLSVIDYPPLIWRGIICVYAALKFKVLLRSILEASQFVKEAKPAKNSSVASPTI